MRPPENIERYEKGEWLCVDEDEASFGDKILSDKGHWRKLKNHHHRCVAMAISSKTATPNIFKGINDNHGRLHLQLAQTGAVLPYHPLGYNQNGNGENDCIILLLLG